MNRTKSIIAAGTLTGLVLLTALAFSFQNIGAKPGNGDATSISEPAPIVIQQPESSPSPDEALQSWQIYSRDLETTVQIMKQREAAYQAQLQTANQSILKLQDLVNNNNAASVKINTPADTSAPTFFDDDDGFEHEEHEREENEHEENEDHD